MLQTVPTHKNLGTRGATTARVVKLQLYCSALAQNVGIQTSTNGAYVDGDVVMENKSNQVLESKIDSSPPGVGKKLSIAETLRQCVNFLQVIV